MKIQKLSLSCPGRDDLKAEISSLKSKGKRLQSKKGFTLVELIVVITILAVLSTIGFVSYSGYLAGTRDTSRIASLKAISEGLELYSTRHNLPNPDEATTQILDNGTQIATQGYVGKNVLETITYSTEGTDPKDGTYYSYYLTRDKKYFQLMAFLEEEENLNSTANAVDYSTRYPTVFGKKLGILVDSNNTPIQELTGSIDISDVGDLELKAYLKDYDYLSGSGTIFKYMVNFAKVGGKFCATYNLECNYPNISITCPTGFIAVPGNPTFNTEEFCVAQYEMSWHGLTDVDDERATYSYLDNGDKGQVVSEAGNSPIAEITQEEAIAECKEIGAHLITNNEWMTIARNIEGQDENWSEGAVGNGFIYNGRSDNTTMGCAGKYDGTNRAGPTGSDCDGGKNKLKLSNGNYIYDLAGNVYEHVNKTNDINSDTGTDGSTTELTSTDGRIEWTDSEIDSTERGKYGPSNSSYDSNNGIGKIYDESVSDNIFLRGANATIASNVGVFTLTLYRTSGNLNRSVGFRCVK